MLKNRPVISGVVLLLLSLLLVFHCDLPQDPYDPSNTSVNMIFKTTDLIKNSLSITDTLGDTIQIGVEINLPKNVDSLRLSISADGVHVSDTTFKNYGKNASITIWKNIRFVTIGTKVVTLTPYSSINLNPIIAVITIIPRSPADTVNRSPKWNMDTLSIMLNDTALYTLQLSTYCSDPDGDSLTYSLLAGAPVGDTVKGNLYTFKATPVAAGKNVAAFIATDPKGAKDTLFLALSIETSAAFTVTYSGNGNTSGVVPVDSGTYVVGVLVTVKANTGILLKTGSTFAGWNTAEDGSGTAYAVGAMFLMGTANDTLYAQWIKKQYTVTYDGNGNIGGAVPTDTNPHDYGTSVMVSANSGNLTKTGYTFAGWNTVANGSGTNYTAGTGSFTITSNTVLYAKWTIKTYTLTYLGNEKSSGNVPSSGIYDSNTTVTVSGNTGALQRDGYNFNGWNTKSDGTGSHYAAGTAIFTISADVSLFAEWTVAQHLVTYNANGGSGTVPVDSGKYLNGVNITVLANPGKLVKVSASFAGWNTLSNGDGTTYACGQTIPMGNQDLILYAKYSTTSVMDNDGNIYSTVTIGSQVWMVQNLKTTKYNDGTPIPLVVGNDDWSILTTPGYCWYYNDESNKNIYGGLYNWYAVNTHKLAPAGWHVPSDNEWGALVVGYCGDSAALKLRAASPLWSSFAFSDSSFVNSTGFSALPGGWREPSGASTTATSVAVWWSTTQYDATSALARFMFFFTPDVTNPNHEKEFGASVRCIRDN